MARIRAIKPDFFRHEALFEAERASGLPLRVAFAGLWTVADREGRFRWKPRTLKLDVLPHDDLDFGTVLNALEDARFIARYTVDGEEYGIILSWAKHQYVNKNEAASDIPEPPSNINARAKTKENKNARVEQEGKGTGREGNGNAREDFEKFWTAFKAPPDANKPEALKAWGETEASRPSLDDLLKAVEGYNAFVAERSRKEKRDYPKQHPKTWLRGQIWIGFMPKPAQAVLDPEYLARMDAIDQMLRRGKYAVQYQ